MCVRLIFTSLDYQRRTNQQWYCNPSNPLTPTELVCSLLTNNNTSWNDVWGWKRKSQTKIKKEVRPFKLPPTQSALEQITGDLECYGLFITKVCLHLEEVNGDKLLGVRGDHEGWGLWVIYSLTNSPPFSFILLTLGEGFLLP